MDNLRLKLAPCRQVCPLNVNCQGYVQLILRGREEEALEMVERELPFPAILGRLCSAQCEGSCHRKNIEGQAVAIRTLKRYVSDLATGTASRVPAKAPDTGKHCAVVGAGPAGMLAAFDLLVRGHAVSVYDAEHEPGGMLRWAIPTFRLPGEVLEAEWAKLKTLGVRFIGGQSLGREISLEQLSDRHDAVIVATGCPRPKRLGIEGEDAAGVMHALDLLRQVRDNQRPQMGRNVVVIGGGDVALDAAQTALRLGAEHVLTVSLESRDILPASAEALELAEREGVELDGSWGPTRILTQNGRIAEVELQRCLAVFDALGRFAPRFDECSLKSVPADTVIIAIGQTRDPVLTDKAAGCDPVTLRMDNQPVFWAGDIVGGPSTIVEAMASGRRAAESVHRLFSGQHMTYGRAYPGPIETEFEIDTSRGSDAERVAPQWRPFTTQSGFQEVEKVLTMEAARTEAGRCYGCGAPFGKYRTCWFCLPCEVECPHDALWVEIPYLLR
jgi:NADPH-dependent glutamate synthase beta subunit-like oxidoreductase